MSQTPPPQDPLEFMKNMWSSMGFALPGMATPTLDVDELDKRIADMKAVEGWLKLNLGTLQMTIQGLEMQRATVVAMQAMSQRAASPPPAPGGASASGDASNTPNAAFGAAGLWPWNLMQPQAPASNPPTAPKSAPKTPPPATSPGPDFPPDAPPDFPPDTPRGGKPRK